MNTAEFNTNIFYFFNGIVGQSPTFDAVTIFFAHYLAYVLVALFCAGILLGQSTRIDKIIYLLSGGVAGVIGCGFIVGIIRYFYHPLRPFVALPNVTALLTETSFSFPSAHATLFFALSAVFYGYNKTFGIWFFVLSAVMGVARVASGVHYPFDILGGAVLGTLVGGLSVFAIKRYFTKTIVSRSSTSTASSNE